MGNVGVLLVLSKNSCSLAVKWRKIAKDWGFQCVLN